MIRLIIKCRCPNISSGHIILLTESSLCFPAWTNCIMMRTKNGAGEKVLESTRRHGLVFISSQMNPAAFGERKS